MIAILNQRRLEDARWAQQLGDRKVCGGVVRAGSHDEPGRAKPEHSNTGVAALEAWQRGWLA